jgi:hypothetical protein
MQEHVLEVGEQLVIESDICLTLTLLAVEAGDVLLGLTAPEPRELSALLSTQGALSTTHKPTEGGVGKDRSN